MPAKDNSKEPTFLNLTKDIVFKTMWYQGDKDFIKYLEKMVEYTLGHPIGKYTLGLNEQGILSYSD